jgi:hypothetical protein
MYLQSIKSVKHNAAKSVTRFILKKSRHSGIGVFIVHSSMVLLLYIEQDKPNWQIKKLEREESGKYPVETMGK